MKHSNTAGTCTRNAHKGEYRGVPKLRPPRPYFGRGGAAHTLARGGLDFGTRMTHSHLGGKSCAIAGNLHSTTTPAPARPALIAIVGLAAGWQSPAPQTTRASARRPGSGSQAQRLQLARGSARAPARCQRGADVSAGRLGHRRARVWKSSSRLPRRERDLQGSFEPIPQC